MSYPVQTYERRQRSGEEATHEPRTSMGVRNVGAVEDVTHNMSLVDVIMSRQRAAAIQAAKIQRDQGRFPVGDVSGQGLRSNRFMEQEQRRQELFDEGSGLADHRRAMRRVGRRLGR